MTNPKVDREYDERVEKLGGDNAGQVSPPGVGSVLSSVPRLISELSTDQISLDWIWDGYIAKEYTTLLSAKFKSGKTTLVSQLLKCIEKERSLAGQRCHNTKILILSEETDWLWADRREKVGFKGDSAWVVCKPLKTKPSSVEWENYLKQQAKFCRDNQIGLVIIDTLADFWSVNNENDASEVGKALKPLNYIKETGAGVLLIHHNRKGATGGDKENTDFESSRGSSAIAAVCDILMDFTKLQGDSQNTQRLLKATGRFGKVTTSEVVISLVNGEYITQGTRKEVGREENLANVLTVLSDAPEPLTITEIHEEWYQEEQGPKPSRKTIDRHIQTLLSSGRVLQSEDKLVGKTSAPTYKVNEPDNAGQDNSDNAGQPKNYGTEVVPNNARQDRHKGGGGSTPKTPPSNQPTLEQQAGGFDWQNPPDEEGEKLV